MKAEEANYSIAAGEIDTRKRWLELGPEDEALLLELDKLIGTRVPELIEHMYAHFLSFPETRAFFPDEATLKRAQTAQAQYFLRLTKGNYDHQYVIERLKVGSIHYKIGLDPKWYLGAYSQVLSWFRTLVAEKHTGDPVKNARLMSVLMKVVFFDMGLAIEAYMSAKESAIREQRDAIADLQTERRVTKSIVENAPVGIVRLDTDFKCVECNQEFLEIIENPRRESVIGKGLFDLLPQLPRQPFQDVLQSGQPSRRTADPLNISVMHPRQLTYWDWATWPMKSGSGENQGIVAEFVSATDRVLLQQQREDFVATLTHDLKTPILAANRAIKLLMEGDFEPVTESQIGILETIYQSNAALYQLVQTLLDVYRYDSGKKKLELQSRDIAQTIKSLVDELRPLAGQKHIEIKTILPQATMEVNCDVAEIKRVIQNLVDNSLKFTPAGGEIVVEMQQSGSVTAVYVKDSGRGISEVDKPKLFQRFWQAASSGRYYASTGLGLYLCRKIVELHGGRIWCESMLGKGSTFAFTIDSQP